VARGLPYIILPPEINLSDPALSYFFKTASYTLEKGDGQTIFGEPIRMYRIYYDLSPDQG
jgi:hypothetical protein